MAINTQLLALRFEEATGCTAKKAQQKTQQYLWLCGSAMLRDHFTIDAGSRYYINATEIQNKLASIKVRGKRHYVWQTFQSFPERVFAVINTGNNIIQEYTMAQANYTMEEVLLAAGTPEELAVEVYRPFADQIAIDDCDNVEIDLRSLANYIKSNLATERRTAQLEEQLDRNLKHAQKIWMLAQANNGSLCQVRNDSVFGRRYYKGPNLQNAPKIVRHAALGQCHEYDLESSVFAWKLSWFRDICRQASDYVAMPATLEYLDHKNAIRKKLARTVFDTDSDWAVNTIKEFITAIGFGAPARSQGYVADNRYRRPALASIITAKERLDRALADPWVRDFVEEQDNMNTVIIGYGKITGEEPQWRAIPELMDKSGKKLLPNSVIAYLYQQHERQILDWFEDFCADKDILLTVHDCIYTRDRVDLQELRAGIQQFGEFYRISHEAHQAWTWEDIDDVAEHRERIRQEEQRAQAIYGSLTLPGIKKAQPKINSNQECYDGSGYTGESSYNPLEDPWFQELTAEEQQEVLTAREVFVPKKSDLPDAIQQLLNR